MTNYTSEFPDMPGQRGVQYTLVIRTLVARTLTLEPGTVPLSLDASSIQEIFPFLQEIYFGDLRGNLTA